MLHITDQPLNRDELIAAVARPAAGGIVVFEGVVRDNARGQQTSYLEYDVYPEMAETKMAEIANEIAAKWPDAKVAAAHRIGRLEIGEASVIIAVSTPHRAEAFAACQYAIDNLKTRVPIWKKEVNPTGESWVEG